MPGGHRRDRATLVAGALTLITVLGACSNSPGGASGGGSGTPGLSATEVDVGSLANISGPVSADFAPIVAGVQAYFDMVNAAGGVNGRKLVLKYKLDDQGIPTQDSEMARTLVAQDHVFAVVGVGTPFFSGAKYLAQQGTPTFGYQVSADWGDGPNLFGQNGSYLDTTSIYGNDARFVHQIGAHSVAVVAYGITASSAGCRLTVNSLQHFGVPVSYQDLAIGFGADLSPDVLQIKSHQSDLVVSCLDLSGNIALSRALQQNGAGSVKQLWFSGYDRDQLVAYPTLMNGVYFYLQQVPFEADAAYPGVYPGMHDYIQTMQRYEPSATYNSVALDGWLNADLFVTGLRATGPNPTQAKVVAAIDKITDYNGGGLIPPVNWTVAHVKSPPPSCEAFVQANQGKFHPVLGTGSSVFVCTGPTSAMPVPAPAGMPGG
jgi:branched-chain amino acid transport system substrate-binding protein